MKRFSAGVFAFFLLSATADAQWLHQGGESAFGGSGTDIAITGDGIYGFGFRCQEEGAFATYITPETMDDGLTIQMGFGVLKLLTRIDDGPIVEEDATADDVDGKLRVNAQTTRQKLEAVRDAKRRISVAVSLEGRISHERSFRAQGSTQAIGKFLKGCKSAAETAD